MKTYLVSVRNEVSATVKVQAEHDTVELGPDEWYDLAAESYDFPGSITIGAFGSASVDDGDWELDSVYDDATGKRVFREPSFAETMRDDLARRLEAAEARIAELEAQRSAVLAVVGPAFGQAGQVVATAVRKILES